VLRGSSALVVDKEKEMWKKEMWKKEMWGDGEDERF
jgi:hypothetical protein